MTPLLLFGDSTATIRSHLSGGYLEADSSTRLVARVTSPDPEVRTPPPAPPGAGVAAAARANVPPEREAPTRKVVAGDRSIRLHGAFGLSERGGSGRSPLSRISR